MTTNKIPTVFSATTNEIPTIFQFFSFFLCLPSSGDLKIDNEMNVLVLLNNVETMIIASIGTPMKKIGHRL